MKVLYIADPNSLHDIRWIKALSEHNIKCYIVPRKAHVKYYKNYGLTILPSLPDPSVVNPIKELTGFNHLRKIIKKFNIDLIHILYAEPNALWTRYKTFLNIPVIITTRGSDILRTIPDFFLNKGWLNRQVAKRYKSAFLKADLITCTSTSQIQAISNIDSSLKEKTVLIRTGVDIDTLSKANENISETFGICKPIILMPRNMKPVYNHEFTLEAIARLPKEVKNSYSFVFVNADSTDSNYFDKIKKMAADINADFYFLPTLAHHQLLSLLKQATLAIMNPLSDGSPVSAMEAMASKLPVILGPLNYDSQIFDGTTYKLKDWDIEELASAIYKLLTLPIEEKKNLVEKAAHSVNTFANTKLEMEKVVGKYKALCN